MTTLPPEPGTPGPAAPGTPSHLHRQVAEGFGADAGRYDRARPGYPADLIERIVAVSPGHDFLDVGCGTGISSRLLAAAGCRVLGLDPDPRMAEQARLGGTETEVAKFEAWDQAGRSFDAVTAAQAWHWVDPAAGAAKAAAALRPGGRLAVFWNSFDPPRELGQAFAEAFRRVMPGGGSGAGTARSIWTRPALDTYRIMGGKAADGMRASGAFAEPEEWLSRWSRPYTRDEWLDFMPTAGGFGRIPENLQREILAGLGAAIDAVGGSFAMGYDTLAVTAVRLAP